MPTRLSRGVRVGNRYRLERELGSGADGITWEAVDERLDRHVALRIFGSELDRKTIVKRAGAAASLTHPRVVRVFDTGEDAGRLFTVSEFVNESLQTVALPLAPDVALQTSIDIAEALLYAHDRGIVHGNLHEGNILLSESGAKVGDFSLSQRAQHADRDDDLRSLGALMSRVTRMPDPAAPPGLSRVIEGLANGAYRSAAEAVGELRALRPAPAAPRPASQRRGFVLIAIGILLAIAALGVMRLGERSGKQQLIPGGRIDGTPLPITGVNDVDPFTTDATKSESPGMVRNVIDKNPQTFWRTETYRESPDFNGKKPGVGVILDLGRSIEVGKAQVLLLAPGCSFELRYSEDKRAPVDEWGTGPKIADTEVAAVALTFDARKARYWLLWITKLTGSGPFSCGVKEVNLYSP